MTSRDKIKILLKEAEMVKKYLAEHGLDDLTEYYDLRSGMFYDEKSGFAEEDYMNIVEYNIQRNKIYADLANIFLKRNGADSALIGEYVLLQGLRNMATYLDIARWSEGKVCFSFTKEMADTLNNSAVSNEEKEIPTEVFNHLPYNHFFIDSSNLGFDAIDSLGIIVSRVPLVENINNSGITSDALRISILSQSQNEILRKTTNIPITRGVYMNDIYEEIKAGMEESLEREKKSFLEIYQHMDQQMIDEEIAPDFKEQMDLVKASIQTIPFIMYLASEKPDIKQSVPPQPKHGQHIVKGVMDGVDKYVVGSDYSIRVKEFIKQQEKNEPSEGTRGDVFRRMPPHERCGHWHHHWVGSDENPEKNGPKRLVLYWQEPTFIHKELKDMVKPIVWEVEKEDTDITR